MLGTSCSLSMDVYLEVKVICRGRCLVGKCIEAIKLFTSKVNVIHY